ncbi:Outer membrane protein beta-barrel domain-containing protein [Chryseobacterium ureilyticum]|uniref:Outer membrane protein beta-barrel domain-containing protein n=1 Tax=Chryseobacterium ureilyticum TaxID=373668 RepID=A0A1N7QJJ5_9FLAO|nr:porin family protein [Chryseobacterium ureilyticum]SIT23062.1 Outer membrane protein beta-barrel domain-containing protein [Chryseobacterium ureilyticum]
MKKLFTGLAFMGVLFLNAQEKKQSTSPISYGVKGGFNASNLSRTDMDRYNYGSQYEEQNNDDRLKPGFHAGVFVNIPVAQKFSIQPELLFSQLGSKAEERYRYASGGSIYKRNVDFTTNLNYLTLPIMVQYNILPQLYVEAGPEFGLLIGGKLKGDMSVEERSGSQINTYRDSFSNKLVMDFYNRFNFGLGVGAGYYFTPKFGVTARFTAGITNVMKNTDSDYKVRNNALQVGVAYKFK